MSIKDLASIIYSFSATRPMKDHIDEHLQAKIEGVMKIIE